jgi:hypothetical protein
VLRIGRARCQRAALFRSEVVFGRFLQGNPRNVGQRSISQNVPECCFRGQKKRPRGPSARGLFKDVGEGRGKADYPRPASLFGKTASRRLSSGRRSHGEDILGKLRRPVKKKGRAVERARPSRRVVARTRRRRRYAEPTRVALKIPGCAASAAHSSKAPYRENLHGTTV